ncbi:helix-turn-helix domain-containing protein [Corynebacterium glyciniphilum]|uniref:helix-turn-helix domain-containing protein n=1 Tax=Corynebacterium glyciniphilum TaxID=1404244 RepID=UPI00264A837D|nr:helix-turn-helix domain-containing protein [Corynebacterium glyciniphilum]MDN6706221.1 helix-turn-helix domain-containing protein [Corynebacterium glyciniphilum]
MAGLSDTPHNPGRGRPKTHLVLSDKEHTTLSGWENDPASDSALALRARIILACAAGATNTHVAAELKVSRPTVGKWRSRFISRRLDGLADEPRSGRPRTMSVEQVKEIMAGRSSAGRRSTTTWTRRELARYTGLSPSTVGRIWKSLDVPDAP